MRAIFHSGAELPISKCQLRQGESLLLVCSLNGIAHELPCCADELLHVTGAGQIHQVCAARWVEGYDRLSACGVGECDE